MEDGASDRLFHIIEHASGTSGPPTRDRQDTLLGAGSIRSSAASLIPPSTLRVRLMNESVTIFGLGAMGAAIAARLASSGYRVRGWNRTTKSFDDLAAADVDVVYGVPEAWIAGSDVLLLSLRDDAAVDAVTSRLIGHAPASSLLIDFSTVSVALARRVGESAKSRDMSYLDAPVSGGRQGAELGSLTIMVGGDASAFDRARALLATLGNVVRHVGPNGSGAATKLINQLLTAVNQAAVIEAYRLARGCGLDLSSLVDILQTSYGASRMLDRSIPYLDTDDFRSSFTVGLLSKDLDAIRQLAASLALALPLAEIAADMYQEAADEGLGDLDPLAMGAVDWAVSP